MLQGEYQKDEESQPISRQVSSERPRAFVRQFSPASSVSDHESAPDIIQAVIWAEKAKHGSSKWVKSCRKDQLEYFWLFRRTAWMTTVAKWVLILTTVFEVPSWCHGSKAICEQHYASLEYSWHAPILPKGVSFLLVTVCWVALGFRMFLQYKAHGKAFELTRWHKFAVAVLGVGLVGTFVSFFFGFGNELSVICRPFMFLCVSKKLRQNCEQIYEALWSFIDVIASLFIAVGVFVWVGVVLFKNTSEGNQYFETWPNALASMWIYFTTSNCPNVFVPGYNDNRYSFIYFFVFLILTMYLIANVLLASVYDAYKDTVTKYYKNFNRNRREGLSRAFFHLSHEGVISRETWEQFFLLFCDPRIGGVIVEDSSQMEYNLWRAHTILDFYHDVKTTNEGLTQSDFTSIMGVFCDHEIFVPARKPPEIRSYNEVMTAMYNFYKNGVKVCGTVLMWDQLVDIVILVASLLTFVQCIFIVSPNFLSLVDEPIFWVLFLVTWFYSIAISTKIALIGVDRFWNTNHVQHRSDFVIVLAMFVVSNVYVLFYRSNPLLQRIILLLNLLRGLRLLKYVKALQHLGHLVLRISQAFIQMLMLLFLVFYVFAIIGQWCFGGLIYASNPVLAGSQFQSSDYWALNFNDLPSGLVTLFALMVVNNWYVVSSGYLLVAGKYEYLAAAYFVLFFVVCNLVVLNILVAIILDASAKFNEFNEEMAGSKVLRSDSHSNISAETMLRQMFEDDEDKSSESSGASMGMSRKVMSPGRTGTPPRMASNLQRDLSRASRYGTMSYPISPSKGLSRSESF